MPVNRHSINTYGSVKRMSEGQEHVPLEDEEARDDFQREVLEYIRATRNEFQMVNEQISKLTDELKDVKKSTLETTQESMKVKKDDDEEDSDDENNGSDE